MRFVAKACFCLLLVTACEQGDIARPGGLRPEDTKPYKETPFGEHGKLRVDGLVVRDAHGDVVQLKGISSQWLNYETTGFARSFAALMWARDNWNVQVIRAAMGVGDSSGNPVIGGYLEDPVGMLNQVDQIVENAKELGLYVIVDWHDHRAYFHEDEAKEFFDKVATRYKGYDNVLYETFNEPMTLPSPDGAFGEYEWSRDIKPYHEAIVKTIRRRDKDALIILGTPRWSQEVDKAALDPVDGTNLLYTLHFYACTHQQWLRDVADTALQAGLPIFVTEWGATDASGGTSDKTVCSDEADRWQRWMDEHDIGWAAWKFDDCGDASCFLRAGAPVDGPFDEWLQGHGPYVVDKLLHGTTPVADAGAPDGGAGDAMAADAASRDAASGSPDNSDAAATSDASAPQSYGGGRGPLPDASTPPELRDAAVGDAAAKDASEPQDAALVGPDAAP